MGCIIVKSPSDTTIYQPVFKKVVGETNEVIDCISNFVDSIHLDPMQRSSVQQPQGNPQPGTSGEANKQSWDEDNPTGLGAAEKVIMDAEQFKAHIQPPKGKVNNVYQTDDDDKF